MFSGDEWRCIALVHVIQWGRVALRLWCRSDAMGAVHVR